MQDNLQELPETPIMSERGNGSRENALRHDAYVREMTALKRERVALIIGEDISGSVPVKPIESIVKGPKVV